jgi:pyruvate dehydrogenase E2 component (dihydrolipoamide acetyltransferase)
LATEVIMPKMGQTMEEGTILKWLVQVGEKVNRGAPLVQIESDKAVFDIEARSSGVLRKIFYDKGVKVPVLSLIAVIGAPEEDLSAYEAPARPSAPVPTLAKEAVAVTPRVEAEVRPTVREEGRILISPRARRLAKGKGIDISLITGTGPGGRIVERDVLAFVEEQERIKVSPMARKIAREAGLELATITGTGAGGRIVKEDVERALAATVAPAVPVTPTVPLAAGETIPMSGVRAVIAERMSLSARTAAHVTLTTEVDATELVRLREQIKEETQKTLGFSTSYNDIMVAIVARALREHPNLNATLAGEEIRLLETINVGVAVDTERGLLVPVIKEADRKGIDQIAREFRDLVERGLAGTLLPDDLTGGTFTLTNLGMYEIDAFTPIINPPECAILGVGRIVAKPVVLGTEEVVVRRMMYLSLSFDHRIVDGAPAARFLQRIKQLVERPYLLFLKGI